MRRLAVLAVAAGALGLSAPSAHAVTKATGCVAGERLTGNAHGFLTTYRGDLYGCPRRQRGGRLVDHATMPSYDWEAPVLSGPMVAVYWSYVWKDALRQVHVFDLKRWQRCSRDSAGTALSLSPDATSYTAGAPITGLTVTRTGAIAFIAGPGSLEAGIQEQPGAWTGYEVVIRDAAGQRQLDAGPDVDPASLRRTGRTLTWTHGTEQRTATLGRGPRPCTSPPEA